MTEKDKKIDRGCKASLLGLNQRRRSGDGGGDMKYFSMYTANSLPKNRLCDDFFVWLKGFDRALWNNGIECFEELFKAKIDELNAQNPRCTPLQFHRWEMGAFGTIGFSASIQDKNCSISLYKIDKEF